MAAVKLDENVSDSVATILRKAGHDPALAREEQLAGTDDDHLLAVAKSEGRVLITLDLDFANIRRHPPTDTPGIVVLRLHRQTLGLIRQSATLRGNFLVREPIRGRLWVLDESRLRIWPGAGPA